MQSYKKTKLAISLAVISISFNSTVLAQTTSSYSVQRFSVPEVSNKPFAVDVHLGRASAHQVGLPDSAYASASFECSWNYNCDVASSSFVQAGITVLPGLSFTYNTQQDRVGMVWQFAGKDLSQSTTGNFAQALVVGVSNNKTKSAVSQATLLSSSSCRIYSDFDLEQDTQSYDLGWVGGYRLDHQWLFYGGPFMARHLIESQSFALCAPPTPLKFIGKQLGANIASQYRFSEHVELNIELVSARYSLNATAHTDTQVNIMLGVRF